MKKLFGLLIAAGLLMGITTASFAQQSLNDAEYSYVTMDLQGILNLTMATNPQVDFVFKTIQEHKNGITKFNAVKLNVDATVSWDLFAYANENGAGWTQVESYSTNGQDTIPSEILEVQVVNGLGQDSAANWPMGTGIYNFQSFTPIQSYGNANLGGDLVPGAATQFLAGALTTAANCQMAPGVAYAEPATHQFRIHYRIKPGIPAKFLNALDATNPRLSPASGADTKVTFFQDPAPTNFAQAGYYYLEVAYVLVEDL